MQDVTWAACVASVVALAGTAINLWFNRANRRDQMQFDTEVVSLKASVRECEEDRAELRKEVEECTERHQESEQDRRDMRTRIEHLEEVVKRTPPEVTRE